MNKPCLLLFAAALTTLACTGQASSQPLTWYYGTVVQTNNFGGEDGSYGDFVWDNSHTVQLWMDVVHIGGLLAGQAYGNRAQFVASGVGAYLPANVPGATYRFSPPESSYTLGMAISDNADGSFGGWLGFTGYFSGSLTSTQGSLTNTFTSPTTQSARIDGRVYTVRVSYDDGGVTNGGPIGPTYGGAIVADVTVSPEPTGLVLAGVGVMSLGLAAWRKRKCPARGRV